MQAEFRAKVKTPSIASSAFEIFIHLCLMGLGINIMCEKWILKIHTLAREKNSKRFFINGM